MSNVSVGGKKIHEKADQKGAGITELYFIVSTLLGKQAQNTNEVNWNKKTLYAV
jgi:hypothetical protein